MGGGRSRVSRRRTWLGLAHWRSAWRGGKGSPRELGRVMQGWELPGQVPSAACEMFAQHPHTGEYNFWEAKFSKIFIFLKIFFEGEIRAGFPGACHPPVVLKISRVDFQVVGQRATFTDSSLLPSGSAGRPQSFPESALLCEICG